MEATGPTQEGRQHQADRQGEHKSTKHGHTQSQTRNKTMSALSHQSSKDHLEQKWAKVRLNLYTLAKLHTRTTTKLNYQNGKRNTISKENMDTIHLCFPIWWLLDPWFPVIIKKNKKQRCVLYWTFIGLINCAEMSYLPQFVQWCECRAEAYVGLKVVLKLNLYLLINVTFSPTFESNMWFLFSCTGGAMVTLHPSVPKSSGL